MRNTSIPTISGPFGPGGTVGSDFVAVSGIPAEDVRIFAASAENYTTVLVSSGTNKLFIEPDRNVYRLDTEGGALAVDLATIEGGADGQQIALLQSNPLHAIVVKDDTDADADDQLVVTGGDFTLLAGGILLLKYKKSLLRWFEVGRYWPSKTHVDPMAPPAEAFGRLPNLTPSTYGSMKDLMALAHSSGWLTGGVVTDAGGGTIDITAGTGFIRATDSDTADLLFFDWAAVSEEEVPTDTTQHVVVQYNSGSPQVVVQASGNVDGNTEFTLATVVNENDTLHTTDHRTVSANPIRELQDRLHNIDHITRADHLGGLILGETGTRNITMSAGTLWNALIKSVISAISTAGADRFDRYYRDGNGGFTKEAAQSQWNNTQYDDGDGGLATLNNNRWSAQYFYIELDGVLISMYGRAQYVTQAQAMDDTPPATVPDRITEHAVIIGRLIFQKGAATGTIETAFDTMFGATGVTDHTNLANIGTNTHVQIDTHISSTQPINLGGTGETAQQAAIDALTDVSGATDEHVLTKDTATGNAVYKAAAGGGGGAPTGGSYVTIAAEGSLSAERVATAAGGVSIVDDGANTTVTISTRAVCFFTAVTGVGTITDKVFELDTKPSDKILESFKSDNDDITLTVEIHVLGGAWQPGDVTVSGAGALPVPIAKEDWVQIGDTRIFTASVNLDDAVDSGTITATMSDGATATVGYERALDPPLVTAAAFDTHAGTTGGIPLVQGDQVATTSVTGTQTVRITGTTEAHATKIWATNAGVSSVEQGPFDVTAGAFDFTINVRSSGNTGAQTATLKAAVGVSGTRGDPENTSNTVTVSHTVPTFSGGAQSDITYPATQEAIKDVETCDVEVTHTNIASGDTYLYDDNTTGELTIPNTTTYLQDKLNVARASGNYREGGTNYRLTVTRDEQNGTVATRSVTVKIAHVAPTLTVTPTTRFGTDNGDNGFRDRTITLTSSQANLSTHTATMTADGGDTSAFTGSWSASGNLAYTRTFRVEDADINAGGQAANNFSWAGVSIKNRAGKEVTTVATNPDYAIGGFQLRRLTIPAWPNREADTSVIIVDTSNVNAELLSKGGGGASGGTDQTFDNSPGQGSTPDDEVDKFCISDGSDLVDDDGQFYYNKDQAAALANSLGNAQVDIEETA